MNRDSFYRWLKTIKKYDQRTCNARISNCQRIENYYGDLDEIYAKDKLENLKKELIYSRQEYRDGIPPKHKIPIDGDIYNGTATLRSALNLYLEFKDNKILQDIMTMDDVIPDEHDGSYELVRETVESLSKTDLNRIDIADLDMLYFMAVGTWKGGVEFRLKKIEESNLSIEEKIRLKSIFNNVVEKAKDHLYENSDKHTWSVGMFGTGFYTFNGKSDKQNAQKYISLCIRIKDLDDEEEIFNIAEETLKNGIKGMQAASASIVLHCLKPNVFPILNNAMIEAAVLLESEDVILNRPYQLTTYIENSRKIRKFRDEKCKFNNYRTLDMKFWEVGKLEEEKHAEIKEEEKPYEIKKETKNMVNNINYWWLNANPKIWSFNDIELGGTISYTSRNERGNKRRIYKNFEDVKKGDIVIGYESTPVKAIVAIGHISGEHDGERIWIKKDENLIEPVEYSYLNSIEELKNMEFFQNPQGSLFKLTKEEYEIIMDIIREQNPIMEARINETYTKEDFLEEVFIEEDKYENIANLLEYKKNIILQGPPGAGKTFVAKRIAYSIMGEKDDSRIEMVQFHQSYSYEDFIMGYRPVEEGFKLRHGVFYQFCKRALNDPHRSYYFIIDEINRGNISKIFGELMMLIESDKRGSDYAIPLTYTENRFYIPKNIYIIGTMNTADRSLAMIDYALRRRFCFIDMEPAYDNLNFKGYLESKSGDLSNIIIDKINRLNKAIENDISLGRGFRIGHSYFCMDKETITEEDYKNIIKYEIVPLLSEYWFDDFDKVIKWKTELLEW